VLFAGTLLMFRAWREGRLAPPWRLHVGLLLIGWGAFNVVEGLVNHHILGVHEVRDDVADATWWNLGFLALGVLLVIVGAGLVTTGRRRAASGTAA
jgi:uncharacterized membrane protein